MTGDANEGLSAANLRRLDRLAEDHRRLFGQRQPITAALMVALSRPVDDIMARDPSNEPEEDVTAIQAIAEGIVRRAVRGDAAAFAQIADRVEGRVGTRKGDADEDVERHRVTVQATIEGVVEAMTQRRIAAPTQVVSALPSPSTVDQTTPDVVPTPEASRLDDDA